MTPLLDSPLSRRDVLRLGAAIGGSAALAGVLAACSPGGATAPVSQGAVNLAFWTHDDAYIKFFKEAVPLADKVTPFDYNLTFTKASSPDLVTKFIAQAVANTGTPDAIGIEVGSFPRMLRGNIAAELLVDLSSSIKDYRDDLIEARLATFSKGDAVYALDSDTPLCVYYYRQDEFARLGIPDDIPTWEEFASIGNDLYKREGVSFGALAVGDLAGTVQSLQILLLQRGGDLFDADGKLSIETPEAEEALTFAANGMQSGFYQGVSDLYGPSMQSGLKQNRILGVDMPSWYSTFGIKPNVPEQEGLWRVRTLPRFAGGGGATAVAGGTGFASVRNKPNTEAATDLVIAAYLDPAQQVKRYVDLGYLPTLRSVYDDPQLAAIGDDYFGGQKLFNVYREVIDEAPALHQSADLPVLNTVLSGYILQAYKGQLTPAQALTAAANDFRGQTRS